MLANSKIILFSRILEDCFDQQTNNTVHGESVFAPQFAESDVYNIFLNYQQKNSSYVEVLKWLTFSTGCTK